MDGDLRGIVRMGNQVFRPFEISPQAGAITSILMATAPELERASGGYYARGKPGRMSRHARSRPDADRLWRVSEQLVARAGFPVPEAGRAGRELSRSSPPAMTVSGPCW
jgi:hypothetical protein